MSYSVPALETACQTSLLVVDAPRVKTKTETQDS